MYNICCLNKVVVVTKFDRISLLKLFGEAFALPFSSSIVKALENSYFDLACLTDHYIIYGFFLGQFFAIFIVATRRILWLFP